MAMSEGRKVLFETQGNVAVITLNRPEQRNAIDAQTCTQLRDAIEIFENDDQLHVGVLCGKGSVFCAGMDLKAFSNGEAEAILFGPGRLGGLVSRSRTKPIIASVKGAALAGGFELMLACDLVVATHSAIFGLPESKRGLIAGAGGAFRLAQILPKAIANEILLTGDPVSANRAAALGLVNKLIKEASIDEEAIKWAQKISLNAPLSVRSSLQLAKCSGFMGEERFWELSDVLLRDLLQSADAAEGAAAFAEKRKPVWTGN